MNWSLLLNPFSKFTEKELLTFGLLIVVLGSILANVIGVTFDGVIDVHMQSKMTLLQSLKENTIIILLLTILLFCLGKIINSKTRLIDILNSVLIFRIPFFLSALLMAIPAVKKLEEELLKNVQTMSALDLKTTDLVILLFLTAALIVLLIYSISLLYNGFKTATNVKQVNHKVLFGITLLTAEILSKIILSIL